MKNFYNFAVGPVTIDEEILKIGAEQIPYFRTEEFSCLMKENEQLVLNSKIDTINDFLSQHTQKDLDELIKLQNELQTNKDNAQKEIDSMRKSLNDQYMSSLSKQDKEKDFVEKQIIEISEPLNKLKYNIETLNRDSLKAKEKVEMIEAREIDEVLICPTCQRPLNKGNSLTQKLQFENHQGND